MERRSSEYPLFTDISCSLCGLIGTNESCTPLQVHTSIFTAPSLRRRVVLFLVENAFTGVIFDLASFLNTHLPACA
ncbi:hypothetical protein FOVSG1_000911 [Fusarium oxysporum f. sp. vasinfectum]